MQETRVCSLGQEYTLEKEMATHSSILAWEIPWTEEPDRVARVRYDLATKEQHRFICICDLMDCSHQAPLSMGFPRQEYWSGLPFPSPGNLSDSRIDPGSPASQADSLPSEPPGKPII